MAGASTAPGSGLGWALVTLAALVLAATVAMALIWTPNARYAFVALAAPLILALAPAGSHTTSSMSPPARRSAGGSIATWAGD